MNQNRRNALNGLLAVMGLCVLVNALAWALRPHPLAIKEVRIVGATERMNKILFDSLIQEGAVQSKDGIAVHGTIRKLSVGESPIVILNIESELDPNHVGVDAHIEVSNREKLTEAELEEVVRASSQAIARAFIENWTEERARQSAEKRKKKAPVGSQTSVDRRARSPSWDLAQYGYVVLYIKTTWRHDLQWSFKFMHT